MFTINFDKEPVGVAAFSATQWHFYAEAAVALLEKQGHKPGVVLLIEGDLGHSVQLVWGAEIAQSKLREVRELAEFGAIAIAVRLVELLSDYRVMEQSVIGTGFDYWLGYKPTDHRYDPNNFLHARLEVSGIAEGSRRDALARLKGKIRQLEVSDYLKIPALIIVVEFSAPFSITFVK